MERKTTQWSEIKNEITDTLAPFLYENETSSNDFTNHYGNIRKGQCHEGIVLSLILKVFKSIHFIVMTNDN